MPFLPKTLCLSTVVQSQRNTSNTSWSNLAQECSPTPVWVGTEVWVLMIQTDKQNCAGMLSIDTSTVLEMFVPCWCSNCAYLDLEDVNKCIDPWNDKQPFCMVSSWTSPALLILITLSTCKGQQGKHYPEMSVFLSITRWHSANIKFTSITMFASKLFSKEIILLK